MTATCMYCGQEVLVPNEQTEGWEVCTCTGAKIRRRYEKVVQEGDEIIEETFGAPCEEAGMTPQDIYVLELLCGIMRPVAKMKIGAVSINLRDGTKAGFRMNAQGDLEISRTMRQKISNTTTKR